MLELREHVFSFTQTQAGNTGSKYYTLLAVEEWQEIIRAQKHASLLYYFAFLSHFNIFHSFSCMDFLHRFPLQFVSEKWPFSGIPFASQRLSAHITEKRWAGQGCCWEPGPVWDPHAQHMHLHCPFLSHASTARATAAPLCFGDVPFLQALMSYHLTRGE